VQKITQGKQKLKTAKIIKKQAAATDKMLDVHVGKIDSVPAETYYMNQLLTASERTLVQNCSKPLNGGV